MFKLSKKVKKLIVLDRKELKKIKGGTSDDQEVVVVADGIIIGDGSLV